MSAERYTELVQQLCQEVGVPDYENVLARNCIEVSGAEVMIHHYSNDEGALYMSFNFGICSAGRTLRVFRMMLEANLTVYAQDQAQMGVNPDTGAIILIVRVAMGDDTDGAYLAETITHYMEHHTYWKGNIVSAEEEMFIGLVSGEYLWLKV